MLTVIDKTGERCACERCYSLVRRCYGGICKRCVQEWAGYTSVYAYERAIDRIRNARRQLEIEGWMVSIIDARLEAAGITVMPPAVARLHPRKPAA